MDLSKVNYRIRVKTPNGNQYTIDQAIFETATLEENEGEVSARLNVSVKNERLSDMWLHTALYVGNYIYVYATASSSWVEVFRGRIYDWETTASKRDVTIVSYDMNYRYQRSEVNIYRRKNETGAQLTRRLIARWKNRKIAKLAGPHRKLPAKAYDKNQTVGEIIQDCIEESAKKGSPRCVIRCIGGEIAVIEEGSNANMYLLTENNLLNDLRDSHSIRNLVTRVRIYRTNEKKQDAQAKLASTIDGKTEYGVLQKLVYTNGKSLNEAKKEANEILKDQGKVEKNRKLIHPDIPFVRKGDAIMANAHTLGTKSKPVKLIVKSVTHDIKNLSMTIRA